MDHSETWKEVGKFVWGSVAILGVVGVLVGLTAYAGEKLVSEPAVWVILGIATTAVGWLGALRCSR